MDAEQFGRWLIFDQVIKISTILKHSKARDSSGTLGDICQDFPMPASLLL